MPNNQHCTFLGVPAAQLWRDLEVWEKFFNEHRVKSLVELGTGDGGFATFLQIQAQYRGISYRTFDRDQPRADLDGCFMQVKDIFTAPGVVEAIKHARRPLVLFCDDGDKPREVAMFSPLLEPGDYLIVHDWGTEIDQHHIPGGFEPIHRDWCQLGMTQMFLRP